jgi:hypothetical protein
MTLEDLETYLSKLTANRIGLNKIDTRRWDMSCVQVDREGKLWLDRTSRQVLAMRRAIRGFARSAQMQNAREQHWQRVSQEREARLPKERDDAARLRRAVLRLVPDKGMPVAAALLDVQAHTIQTFVGQELQELRAAIEVFGFVAARRVREALHAIGVSDQDRFRLVDLRPPRKTRRLNRQGRLLTITPELLITSTTGISRPLGEPSRIAAYLRRGEIGKLRRRIESDVKALYAFYNYGMLHGCVRLRWGFLDEVYPVDWAIPGDTQLYERLRAFRGTGEQVDLVWGWVPSWTDPWSRACRVRIVSLGLLHVGIESRGQRRSLWRYDIQAVRPAKRSLGGV